MCKHLTFTYTVCILDDKGRVESYVRPSHSDPGEALVHLKAVRKDRQYLPYARIAVVRTVIDLLDVEELIKIIDETDESM